MCSLLSPSNFSVTNTMANDFALSNGGYGNSNWITNSIGVRASFLLRLANANALRVNGYGY